MRSTTRIAVLLAFLVVPVAACEQPESEGGTMDMEEQGQQIEQETEEIGAEVNPGEEQQAQDTVTRTDRREAGAVTLQIAEHPTFGSPYITDGEGRALYMFTADSEGQSTCTDACAEAWPPVTIESSGTPSLQSDQLQQDLVGTIERQDGSMQVTYNGHPLYHYATDEVGAEQPTGHGFGGEWFLVTPAGEQLQSEEGVQNTEEQGAA